MNYTFNHTSGTEETADVSQSCVEQSEKYDLDVPIYYLGIFLFIIWVCSIYYFIKLKNDKVIYVHGVKSGIKAYSQLLVRFRSMYASVFTQLFDQVSDISVINQLYFLSNDEANEQNDDICQCMSCTASVVYNRYIFTSNLK